VAYETVARATTPRGEVVLRRDPAGALELRVNGVFVMDTVRTATEEALADLVLERLTHPGRLLVGGLGLGFTVRRLLADTRVRKVVVAEIEPPVADWMRDGTIPHGPAILADPRVELRVADVREVVSATEGGTLDAVLLDVDNGPDGLVHDGNAAVYDPAFLVECGHALRPGGRLAIWSATRSTALETALRATLDDVEHLPYDVDLDGRAEEYSVYVATPPDNLPA
jgi:spermidine synthase